MRYFLSNTNKLTDIGRRGRDYVIENYAEDIVTQKWYDLFKKLEEKKGINDKLYFTKCFRFLS